MNVFLFTSVPLAPPWDQGDKNLAYALAQALPETDFQVLTSASRESPPGANLLKLPLYDASLPVMLQKARVLAWLASRGAFPRLGINGHRPTWLEPDIYHLIYRPYRLSSRMFRLLPEFKRKPTIHTVPAAAHGERMDAALFFADRIVALSEYGRQALLRAGLLDVRVIPTGIAIDRWLDLAGRSEEFKQQYGLSGRQVILFPGHYGKGQGADLMASALPRLVARHPEVVVVFACRIRSSFDRQNAREIQHQIETQGLGHAARFLTTVPDMSTLIGASDLLVLPLETLRDKVDIPTTLLEGMAAGKPVVVSDLAPMNELITGKVDSTGMGDTGYKTPLRDVAALVDAVSSLLGSASLTEMMGQAGQALVRSRFNIDVAACEYDKLYRELSK